MTEKEELEAAEKLIDSLAWAEFRRCILMGVVLLAPTALLLPSHFWTPLFITFATAKICSTINRQGTGLGLTLNSIEKKYLKKVEPTK